MLKIVGAIGKQYIVESSDTGEKRFMPAEGLVIALSMGVEIVGCEYGRQGLVVWYEGCERHDVAVEVFKPVSIFNTRTEFGKWKYEVSNLGHVRVNKFKCEDLSIRQTRIYTPNPIGNYGTRPVNMRVDGKKRTCSLRQLVATEFIPNPNGYDRVMQKDPGVDEDSAWNLYWISNVAMLDTLNLVKVDFDKPVRQYTLDGKFVAEYSSVTEAAAPFGENAAVVITSACRRKKNHDSVYGYIWRFTTDDEFCAGTVQTETVYKKIVIAGREEFQRKERRHYMKEATANRPIRQYTREGILVAEHPNLQVASYVSGCAVTNIGAVCRRYRNCITSGGFFWRFADDDEFANPGLEVKTRELDVDHVNRYQRRGIHVRQYTLDGEFVAEYNSPSEAAKKSGLANGSIIRCCQRSKKYHHCGKFIWRYVYDDEFAVKG